VPFAGTIEQLHPSLLEAELGLGVSSVLACAGLIDIQVAIDIAHGHLAQLAGRALEKDAVHRVQERAFAIVQINDRCFQVTGRKYAAAVGHHDVEVIVAVAVDELEPIRVAAAVTTICAGLRTAVLLPRTQRACGLAATNWKPHQQRAAIERDERSRALSHEV